MTAAKRIGIRVAVLLCILYAALAASIGHMYHWHPLRMVWRDAGTLFVAIMITAVLLALASVYMAHRL